MSLGNPSQQAFDFWSFKDWVGRGNLEGSRNIERIYQSINRHV